jgi:hypothetical protein
MEAGAYLLLACPERKGRNTPVCLCGLQDGQARRISLAGIACERGPVARAGGFRVVAHSVAVAYLICFPDRNRDRPEGPRIRCGPTVTVSVRLSRTRRGVFSPPEG